MNAPSTATMPGLVKACPESASQLRAHEAGAVGGSCRSAWQDNVMACLLAAFAFFIPLESVLTTGLFTVTKGVGILLLAAALFSARSVFGRIPFVVACVGAYLAVDGLVSAISGGDRATATRVLLTYLQSWIFLWIAARAFRSDATAMLTASSFVAGIVLAAGLTLAGIGQTSMQDAGFDRTSFGVRDPNENALLFGMGLIGCLIVSIRASKARRLLLLVPVPLLAAMLVQSGSRTGLLATIAGLAVMLLVGVLTTRTRWFTLIIGSAGVACLLAVALNSDGLQYRIEKAIFDRDTSFRRELFAATWEAFSERPVFGWGEGLVYQEVAQRYGYSQRDTGEMSHNELLGMLATTGVIGSLPALLMVGFLVLRSWQCRQTDRGFLAFAFLIMVLVASLTLTVHYLKATWLTLAFAGTCLPPNSRPRAKAEEL